jgi:ornithine cyclodeaminase
VGITVLVEEEIRRLVGLGDEELAAVEAVYPLISAGVGSMPPIQRVDVPEANGEIDIKSAYLPGYDGIAVKISAGFFDNPSKGLPSLGGLMLVFDSQTGRPTAALFDNGYLTDVRTALGGAVAARHLALPAASTVGVLGAGVQARLQIEALRLVRPVERILIWARRPEAAEALAGTIRSELGLDASAVATPSEVVVEGGIVVTATPSTEPLLSTAALRPGLHITAVGSDAEHKQELGLDVVNAAAPFVCDSRAQSERLGELRVPMAAGEVPSSVVELGAVVDGSTAGRSDATAITVCDLTGTGAQDTAIASLTVARAKAQGTGTVIQTG